MNQQQPSWGLWPFFFKVVVPSSLILFLVLFGKMFFGHIQESDLGGGLTGIESENSKSELQGNDDAIEINTEDEDLKDLERAKEYSTARKSGDNDHYARKGSGKEVREGGFSVSDRYLQMMYERAKQAAKMDKNLDREKIVAEMERLSYAAKKPQYYSPEKMVKKFSGKDAFLKTSSGSSYLSEKGGNSKSARDNKALSSKIASIKGADEEIDFVNHYEYAPEKDELGRVKQAYFDTKMDGVIVREPVYRYPLTDESYAMAINLKMDMGKLNNALEDYTWKEIKELYERERAYQPYQPKTAAKNKRVEASVLGFNKKKSKKKNKGAQAGW